MLPLFFLLLQTGDNLLTSAPPPAGGDDFWWWPIAMWSLPLFASGLAAWWANKARRSEKQLELRYELQSKENDLRIAQLETDAEQRDKVFDRLLKQNEMVLHDNELLRDRLDQKDTLIAELRGIINELKSRVRTLENKGL